MIHHLRNDKAFTLVRSPIAWTAIGTSEDTDFPGKQ